MALSDPLGILATPLTIIERQDEQKDIQVIVDIINLHQVKQVIIGLPRSMDGTIGEQAEKVRAFAGRLSSQTEVPMEFRDERLTTVSARRLMQAASVRRTRKKTRDDAIAAALILQGYLEEMRE
ncbi:MAG: Holliday junction resolvase RuvX [Dehalococcoidales bacterium]|nr:Holliday junction resolvase RuvX [Dehalococcoidales bacterium]